jgi:hypothetical protein
VTTTTTACVCGHDEARHEHYTNREDCVVCGCMTYRPPSRHIVSVSVTVGWVFGPRVHRADSRVEKLAQYARDNHDDVGDKDGEWVGSEEALADNTIRVIEAAGLTVIDTTDAALINRIQDVVCDHVEVPDGAYCMCHEVTRAVLDALKGGA